MVKISIITISYNSEKTIECTIQSVLNQHYENLEYIIIDGGSKDSTLDIIQKYKNRISYFVSEPDKGISDAFNKGVAAATGDVIGIINSDDLLLPNALEIIADSYDEISDVYLGSLLVNDSDSKQQILSIPSTEYKVQSRNIIVCHPSTFIAKKAYQKYGQYRVEFKYMMDQDLLTRMYIGGAVFKRIGGPLAQFNCGGVTDHTDFKKGLNEYLLMIKYNGGSWLLRVSMIIRVSCYRLSKELLKSLGLWSKIKEFKYQKK